MRWTGSSRTTTTAGSASWTRRRSPATAQARSAQCASTRPRTCARSTPTRSSTAGSCISPHLRPRSRWTQSSVVSSCLSVSAVGHTRGRTLIFHISRRRASVHGLAALLVDGNPDKPTAEVTEMVTRDLFLGMRWRPRVRISCCWSQGQSARAGPQILTCFCRGGRDAWPGSGLTRAQRPIRLFEQGDLRGHPRENTAIRARADVLSGWHALRTSQHPIGFWVASMAVALLPVIAEAWPTATRRSSETPVGPTEKEAHGGP
jgi:hypothetical protein